MKYKATVYDDAWLGLGKLNDIVIAKNPMINRSELEIANPDLHLLKILRNPKYFGSTAQILFNVELHPMQIAILQEFWIRPFPMYIASRGFGKMLKSDELIRVKNGWKKIKDISVGDMIYGGDGNLTKVVQKTDLQKNLKMYRLTLRDGRTIDACEDHQWKVFSHKNKKWEVKKTKDMLDFKRSRKGKKSNGTEYLYALPINEALIHEKEKDIELHPYILGVLLGDGCLTQNRITFSSKDPEIVQRVNSLLPDGYYTSAYSDGITYGINCRDKEPFYKIIEKLGLLKTKSLTKFIPHDYLYNSYEKKLQLLQGLMDTDGYSNGQSVIEYYTISKQLSEDVLNLSRSLGIHCKCQTKPSMYNGKKYNDCYRITMYTKLNVFTLDRKLKYLQHTISKQGQSKYDKVFITNIEKIENSEGYCIMVDNHDNTYITKDYIVTHNSFLMALYCVLRCILVPGTKIVVVGAAFRQSKIIFEYMETLWRNSPILRSIFNGNDDGPRRDVDRCTIRLGDSWTIAVPMGDGSKIRGLRAHIIIADEFASISPDIYETVVSGFAAVSASPIQNVKEEAKKDALKEAGLWNTELENLNVKKGNQAIISGTADYDFKHFASYWKRYKQIIESKGDINKLTELFNGEVPDNFNWQDYSIIRIPYELIPKGFMDDKQVSRAKATIHTSIYNMEYAACFVKDSEGFFRRSLIESCVVSNNAIIINEEPIIFDAVTQGDSSKNYVYGIDPASEKDNFSIVILEVHPTHSRVVYCWTTNRANFRERQKIGLVLEHDFYGFCVRKIRNLMKTFPPIKIGMDAQGGGVAIEEALHDPAKLSEDEVLIWPSIEDNKTKDTDSQSGLHILDLVQFAKSDWTSQANHGMRKDLEDKRLLFPRFDNLTLGLALDSETKDILSTDLTSPLYDNLSECILEIEELKNELTSIVMTQTSTGPNSRDRWDTPETKLSNHRKGRLRKDRYSALLIANMIARQAQRILDPVSYDIIGADARTAVDTKGKMYNGPSWFTNQANDDIYTGIYRE